MNIRKKILTRCGALLTAVLVLAPTALAAEPFPEVPKVQVCYPTSVTRSEDGTGGLAAAAGEPLAHGAGGI